MTISTSHLLASQTLLWLLLFSAGKYSFSEGFQISPSSRSHAAFRLADKLGSNDDYAAKWVQRAKKSVLSQNPKAAAFSGVMVLSGAALGPFLDSYHSLFGVLQYEQPLTAMLWGSADRPGLVTAWWVPELFGLAGFLIGWLYILGDVVLQTESDDAQPSVPKIFVGISLFTFQYWLSGVLYEIQVDRATIFAIMSVVAATGFFLLDGTFVGLLVSAATLVCGPAIEVGLLSLSRAGVFEGSGYRYNDLGETGFFPLWILPVYFLGGPAVGGLARGWWNNLSGNEGSRASTQQAPVLPGCDVCNGSRRVPCPNCDGNGDYVVMGNIRTVCTSCRGRGFVICRTCFSSYREDPDDIEAIRDVVSRFPD